MGDWNPRSLDEFMNATLDRLQPIRNIFDNIQIRSISPVGQGIDNDNDHFDTDKAAFDESYANYKKLFEFIVQEYGIITIPRGTLIFHSNQYFNYFLKAMEPIGFNMKIQDIRTYKNKNQYLGHEPLPMTETNSRIYANFTPAGNLKVEANISASEHIYVAKEDIQFLQLPPVEYDGRVTCIKDHFQITSTSFLKRFIQEENTKLGKPTFCGYILMTAVDRCDSFDDRATKLNYTGGKFVYPEVLILDGFDKFKKCGQYDFLQIDAQTVVPLSRGPGRKLPFLKQFIKQLNKGEELKESRMPRTDISVLLNKCKEGLHYGESRVTITGGRKNSFGYLDEILIYILEDFSKRIEYDIFDEKFGVDP